MSEKKQCHLSCESPKINAGWTKISFTGRNAWFGSASKVWALATAKVFPENPPEAFINKQCALNSQK